MRRPRGFIFTGALLLGALIALWAAWNIRLMPFDPVGGRLFPLLVSAALAGLVLVLAITDWRAMPPEPTGSRRGPAPSVIQPLLLAGIVAMTLWALSTDMIGLLPAIAIVVVLGGAVLALEPGQSTAQRLRRLGLLIVAAAVLTLAAHLGFERLLGIRL